MSSSPSFLQLQSLSPCALPSVNNPQLNVRGSNLIGCRIARCSSVKKSSYYVDKKFFGTRLSPCRSMGSEMRHFWQWDGPGRSLKLRVVVRSALSVVPEKPLGLYDPSCYKDSCGVGFIVELSDESSRKTA